MADRIERFLEKRRKEGLLRSLSAITSRNNGRIVFKGREYIDFSSNDYLGLSGHPRLIEASKEALEKRGIWRGLFLTAKRLLKCHPRTEGGWDPVP